MYKFMQLLRKAIGFLLDLSGLLRAGIRIGEDRIQYYEAWRGPTGFRIRRFIEERDFDLRNLEFALSRLFQKKGGILPWSVNTTLESKGVIAKIITIPRVPKQKIATSIIWEIRKYLPLEPDQVIVDHQIIGSSEVDGRPQWTVLFVAAKRAEVERSLEIFSRFGIRVKSVRYLPLSFVNSYRKNSMDTSIAYVTFAEKKVCISILEKDRLLLTNTSFLKGRKALNRHVLEVLKKFIEERVSFLERVVVSGGDGEFLESVMDKLNILAAPAEDDDLVLPVGRDFLEDDGRVSFLFGTLCNEPVDINLVPEETKKNNKKQRTLAMAVLGVTVFITALVALFFDMRSEVSGLDPGKMRNLQWIRGFRKQIRSIEAEITRLGKIRRRRSVWSRRLAGIAWIMRERKLSGKLWLRRISSDRKNRGFIEGVALGNGNVTDFLAGLERFPLIGNAVVAYIRPLVIRKRRCVRFRITFSLKGGAYGR